MHVQRLSERLALQGWLVEQADDSGRGGLRLLAWLKLTLLAYRLRGGKLIHVQSGNWRSRCFAALFARGFGLRSVVTVHSFRPLSNQRTSILARWTMHLAHRLIVTNEEIRQRCLDHGAHLRKIRVQHAYLDAPGVETPELFQQLAARHDGLIAANAFRLRKHMGEDLYGLDLLVELMGRLVSDHPRLGLVFLLPETGDDELLANARQRIAELDLETRFHIVQDALPFTSLIKLARVMIRPTNTDGDSLSVREALSAGIHVIASDVIQRPDGTRLFRNRELSDLEAVTRACLSEEPPGSQQDQDGLAGVLLSYREALA
jgi:glycosyltransferase involved in cell wall biosynthesis